MFARFGYVGFAADIFGMLPKDVPEMQAQTAIYNKDRALMKARAQAGYDALARHPLVDATKIAQAGYCFGGTVVAEFGSTGVPLAATIAIHGSFNNHPAGWAKGLKGKMLILHGAEDSGLSARHHCRRGRRTPRGEGGLPIRGLQRRPHGFSVPKSKADQRADIQSRASAGRLPEGGLRRRVGLFM